MKESIYEMINHHNNSIEKMQTLAEKLLDIENIEETPVNQAFCDAFNSLKASAIMICCEANAINSESWYVDEFGYILSNNEENSEKSLDK